MKVFTFVSCIALLAVSNAQEQHRAALTEVVEHDLAHPFSEANALSSFTAACECNPQQELFLLKRMLWRSNLER
ncbi:hypothetical protein PT974_07262 [Cladobotryum mycophilum]|uniref:Uncharacterized protein n=1 Tax=Cladobotryum mycophilum TaxID=491253 RepID=A0ABR0SQ06_9HYPO